MGLLGAGISTLASRIMMVIVFALIFFCTKRYHIYKEGFVHSKINRADFIYLNKLGWPIALQMGMETASFSLSAIMVGWIGTTALAAHQIMLAISQVCFMMYYGMGAAVAVRVSNFNGQNDRVNVRRTAYSGFHIMLGIALIGALPIFLLRHQLGGWFSDSQAVSVTVAQLIIPFIVYQFGDGLQINFANALRGIADVKPMMYIAFIAYFLISLPAGYFFGFVMDWPSHSVSLLPVSCIIYVSGRERLKNINHHFEVFVYATFINTTESSFRLHLAHASVICFHSVYQP